MAYGRKNFASISPVKWFMSFVKTSSLRSVGIRKIGREDFYYLEVDKPSVLCTVPSLTSTPVLTTHTPTAIGLTRNHHLSVCFGRESFADCVENSAQHLHKASLKSSLGFFMSWYCLSCHGNWMPQSKCFKVINLTLTHIRNGIEKELCYHLAS